MSGFFALALFRRVSSVHDFFENRVQCQCRVLLISKILSEVSVALPKSAKVLTKVLIILNIFKALNFSLLSIFLQKINIILSSYQLRTDIFNFWT